MQQEIVSVHNLTKTFPGQRAVDDVTLSILGGEVHVLCGQNGSGKSTLIKVLSGYHEPDPGSRIMLLGNEIRPWRGEGSHRMHFIHQDLGLVNSLDAVENLALGHGYGVHGLMPVRWKAQRRAARLLLRQLGLEVDVRRPVGELPALERTMIAVARSLRGWSDDVGLLVLDEPTVSMSKVEVDRLFTAIAEVRRRGAGVLYVSHRLEEVFAIGDRVSVLREGRLVLASRVADTTHDELVTAIAGRAVEQVTLGAHVSTRRIALSVQDLVGTNLDGISLDVHEGEIVGVTGLAGSGVDDLAEALFGAAPIDRGSITYNGRTYRSLTPRKARETGMALLPANRPVKGCIPAFSLRENMTLPRLRPLLTRSFRISRRRERRDVLSWMERVELRPPDPERPLASFSGGNQQKAVIARWLRLQPDVLVLHEPTQGVDVGAKVAIHKLLGEAAEGGAAILACSCDVVDLTKMCQRIVVLANGRIVADFSDDDITEDNIWASLLRSRTESRPAAAPEAAARGGQS
jgi:ribose transport system ATP-binding protein